MVIEARQLIKGFMIAAERGEPQGCEDLREVYYNGCVLQLKDREVTIEAEEARACIFALNAKIAGVLEGRRRYVDSILTRSARRRDKTASETKQFMERPGSYMSYNMGTRRWSVQFDGSDSTVIQRYIQGCAHGEPVRVLYGAPEVPEEAKVAESESAEEEQALIGSELWGLIS